MKRRTLLCSLTVLAGLPAASLASGPTTIEGVSFAPQLRLAERMLQLNGVGLRAVLWLKGYAAGLYLDHRERRADQVIAMGGPKRVRMHMLLDVPAPEFVKAVHKGMNRNSPPALRPQIAERVELFSQLITQLNKVVKGDVIDLDFIPERGLVFSLNGRTVGAPIPGADFYGALLGVFIGPQPVDDELKAGLLGQGT